MKHKNSAPRSPQAIRSLRPLVHFFKHLNEEKALSNLKRFSEIFLESYEERRTQKEGENKHLKSKLKKKNKTKQTISTTTKLKAKKIKCGPYNTAV